MMNLQLSPQNAALELLARRKARESLIAFSTYTNSAYIPAPHHNLIAEKLEAVERGEIKRLMITMPPRHGKSELASRRFPARYMGRNPGKQIIAASYNSDLANDFGREVRNIVDSPEFSALFSVKLAQDSKAANRWHTDSGGMYVAAGVGTAITGRGADILLIDDPFKDRQEADSEVTRQRVWDWYTSTAYTRLMPGGAIIVINCMVGDTQVLMYDGSQKELKNICKGDLVATHKDGKLSVSKVLNWVNHGRDLVYSIRTNSGIIVKANERHPFLVERDGVQEWIRLGKLKTGDKLLRASIGGNGAALNALTMDVASRSALKDGAHLTTTKPNGQVDTERHQLIQNHNSQHTYVIVTELGANSTKAYLTPKMVNAQFAEWRMGRQHGGTSYALTMTMPRVKYGDYFAITATLPLGLEKQQMYCGEPLSTYKITVDEIIEIAEVGYEDVFDIQVENTENFIANGLVSHNTRWHDDDLSGRLLEEQKTGGDKWELLSLPAINPEGEPLWPEWYPLDRLEQIKAVLPSRDWNALYQQNPIPDDGDYFKKDWFGEYDELPANLRMYGASDYAVTDGDGDFTEHGIAGVDASKNVYIVDWWKKQAASDVWIEAQCEMILKHSPHCWFGEAGPIRRAIEPFLNQRMQAREAYCRVEWLASIADKPTRARPIQALASMGKVFFPKKAHWKDDLINQMLRFPAGKHDDGVDVMSLFGRGMEYIRGPKAKAKAGPQQYATHAQGWMS